jgi:hypothetical protein
MKARKSKTSKRDKGPFVVRRPSTLQNYIRLYRMRNGVLKKAKEIEETLSPAA